jgi:hypothetical protein
MSNQIIVYGATVERSTDGTTYEVIPHCKSVAIPVVETDYIDSTSLDSEDGFKEYVKSMKDAGVFDIDAGYSAAGYEQQLADQAQEPAIYYRTTLKLQEGQATGDAFTYRGFPTPSVEGGDINGLISMKISIRTTAGVAWVRGTAV